MLRRKRIRQRGGVEAAVHSITSVLREQVRMVAALGAVTGFDDWAPRLLASAPPDQLRNELIAATRDILRLARVRRARAAAVSAN